MATTNPVRGCGTLKRGGYYLQADMSATGSLNIMTWVLGSHMTLYAHRKGNLFTSLPNRAMTFFNPAASLTLGKIVMSGIDPELDRLPDEENYEKLRLIVGKYGLIDLVGSKYYTPLSFANELAKHGPSRKVPEHIAVNLAKENVFPLPIFFAHNQMPVFDTLTKRDNVFDLSCSFVGVDHIGWNYGPTWLRYGWGLTVDDEYNGDNHFVLPILSALESLPVQEMEEAGRLGNSFSQTVFCASWITKSIYVLKDKNDPGNPFVENVDLDEIET